MKFFAVATAFAAAVVATSTPAPYKPCMSTLFSNTLCCATDALGIIGLDCEVPNDTPRDARHFREICAKSGQQAKCCVLPVLDQAVLCDNPVGL